MIVFFDSDCDGDGDVHKVHFRGNNVDIGYFCTGNFCLRPFFQARSEASTKPIDAKTEAHDTGYYCPLNYLFTLG